MDCQEIIEHWVQECSRRFKEEIEEEFNGEYFPDDDESDEAVAK